MALSEGIEARISKSTKQHEAAKSFLKTKSLDRPTENRSTICFKARNSSAVKFLFSNFTIALLIYRLFWSLTICSPNILCDSEQGERSLKNPSKSDRRARIKSPFFLICICLFIMHLVGKSFSILPCERIINRIADRVHRELRSSS